MTQILTGLFDRYEDARRAVQDLEAAGMAHRDISIVANDTRGEHHAQLDPAAQDAGAGAGIGAAVGGLGGLLAGLGLIAIPGIGPVVAAGWLVATAAGVAGGALVGAAAGGLVGALTHAGVPERDAHVYAEGVRRGGTLVTAKVDEPLAPTARAILSDNRTVNLSDRRQAYEAEGWERFHDDAPGYTASEIEAERLRFQRP
jgi:hypothetical protein